MAEVKISREQYPELVKRFVELVTEKEKNYIDKLKDESISTPLATHFIMGETLVNTYSGSPANTLPTWVKDILNDCFNQAINEILSKNKNES